MKLAILVVLFGGVFVFDVTGVSAQCRCKGVERDDGQVSVYNDAYEELQNSDVVFVGEVIDTHRFTENALHGSIREIEQATFKIEQQWKGSYQVKITVRTFETGCTNGYKVGDHRLIFANYSEGNYWTGCCCTRNTSLEKAVDYLKLFKDEGLTPQGPRKGSDQKKHNER
jgi:hypothetical protein